MKRLSSDQLQLKAWQSGRPIEIDHEQGIAVIKIGATVYYASLSDIESCS